MILKDFQLAISAILDGAFDLRNFTRGKLFQGLCDPAFVNGSDLIDHDLELVFG
jgi:hypothetical protein